jgi:hypothetical protein
MMSPHIESELSFLESLIREECGSGFTIRAREWPSLPDGRSGADAVAVDSGFGPGGAEWVEYTRDEAELVLAFVLHRDLAYSSQLMDLETASFTARRLMSLVPAAAIFYGNREVPADFNGLGGCSWVSISNSTFDAGVVALSDRFSMIVWVEAED